MTPQQMKDFRTKFRDVVINDRNLDAFESFFDPSFKDNAPLSVAGGEIDDLTPIERGKQRHTILFEAFPDMQMDIKQMVAEGEWITTWFTLRGTHKGDYIGIPATGKEVSFDAIDITCIKDNKIFEHNNIIDRLTMLQQLGKIPA